MQDGHLPPGLQWIIRVMRPGRGFAGFRKALQFRYPHRFSLKHFLDRESVLQQLQPVKWFVVLQYVSYENVAPGWVLGAVHSYGFIEYTDALKWAKLSA
jgi:hypothetical protein